MDKITLLDEKDRKILVELDKNARQTDSEIAKKVGLSKQVTNYRIQNLVERGIITNFYTIVNVGKLGLNSYYVFLQLEKINKEREKELLEKLNSLDYVGWLVSGTGRWDVVSLVYADSISTFDNLLNQITNICGNNLHECNFTTLISSEHISYKFLGQTNKDSLKQTEKTEVKKLDKTDKKILEVIEQKARASIVEISQEAKIPLHIASYNLKKLIREKIIEGFEPKLNINKLGFQWHLLLIQFQKITEKRKQEFIDFCKHHKKIYYVTSTLGLYNMMLDIHVKDTEEFKEVLLSLKENFSDIIKLYESIIIFDEYKISYFPKRLI
jgi:DNA-binding Lrp family transcriptional regulator